MLVGATGICEMTGPPGRRDLTRRPQERERVYGVDLEEIRALRAKCTIKKKAQRSKIRSYLVQTPGRKSQSIQHTNGAH